MKSDFINTLVADGPDDKYRDQLMLFGQFVGTWDFEWIGHNADGSTWSVPGEWIFSWILEGRAIQDNWICPAREFRGTGKYPEGELGTTLRYYNHESDEWRTVWVGPHLNLMFFFKVIRKGDDIEINEINVDNKETITRWMFTDIKSDSFRWTAYDSNDDGKSWLLTQEVLANRRK